MSDRTFCQMEAKDLSLAVATLVAAAFHAEDGYHGTELVDMAKDLMSAGQLTIEEIPCGYSDALFTAVRAVVQETGIDFRFRLWEDPAYQWLGTMHYHIPGLNDVSSDCDANGQILVNGPSIVEMLDSPLYTATAAAMNWLRNAACAAHVQAWNA
jgi:hypothetical protein